MVAAFLKGILLGLTVAFLVGPVFFALLQTSIYRGFRAGVKMAVGVVLSDFLLVFLSYIGLLQLLNNSENNLIFGALGSIVLIIFGVVTFNRKPVLKTNENKLKVPLKKPGTLTYIVKGFFMNILNPFLLLFWASAMSIYTTNQEVEKSEIIMFFSTVLATIFVTDVVKCYVAKKIKRYINEKSLFWINRIVGIILLCFGVLLIGRVILSSDFF
ncbi:MAG: LysE family translocator [Bacteroidales bacterium]|nr:LysE family translocator [Bacteroidales bacterium]